MAKKLVNRLVEDIKDLIGNSNKTQIIVATHSPIFLSDIPKANILFLKNEDNQCKVDDNCFHYDTFGNNVHTLFLDSFFLSEEGTMGDFAEYKINEILRNLRSNTKINDKDSKIINTINCIGDKLIKNKLLELYEKNQRIQVTSGTDKSKGRNSAIQDTIILLKDQIRELIKTVEQLESMKNDQD